eukprot:comp12585_c0_seq1/m.16624 comp12585_c0_seq1/g.16624  ORF comp12585_c0_seq1/g.16624 comp12585_c0_seq1/m.16624 type:complete len:365 (-) comp12585_c0_seq1:15-1109(-)
MEEKANECKERGNEFFARGEHAQAEAAFSEGIMHDPSNHALYSNRCAARSALGKLNLALDDAKKTIQLKPTWPKGYSRLGTTYVMMNRFDEAREAYQNGLKHDKTNQMLLDGLKTCEEMRETFNRGVDPNAPPIVPEIASTMLSTFVGVLHGMVLFSAVVALIPLIVPENIKLASFRFAMMLSLVVFAISLFGRVGRPKFSREYWSSIGMNDNLHYMLMAFVFMNGNPLVVALLPFVLCSIMGFKEFVLKRASPAMLEREPLKGALLKFAPIEREMPRLLGVLEAMTWIFMVFMLITPFRDLMQLFFYSQLMKLRYRSNSFTRFGFDHVGGQIDQLFNHQYFPSFLAGPLRAIKAKFTSFATRM